MIEFDEGIAWDTPFGGSGGSSRPVSPYAAINAFSTDPNPLMAVSTTRRKVSVPIAIAGRQHGSANCVSHRRLVLYYPHSDTRCVPTMRAIIRSICCVAIAALPARLLSQGVTIQSSVDVHLQGALGAIASMAARMTGNSMHNTPTTTYVSGHKLRTENGNTETIIDADAGRITSIDNKQKTYSSMTFDEMAAMMKKMQESAQESRRQAKEPAASRDPNAPKGEMNMKYKVETDRPGQHENIAGYDAERMFVTITMQGEAKPDNGSAQDVGSLVLLLDEWISKDAPQMKAMAEFQRAYAKKAGQAFKAQTQGLQAMFSADPRMKGGLEAVGKEMAKMHGTPLRSIMYFSLVPPGAQFDRQLALNDASAADAQAKSTHDEKPKGGGGFGGMFGRLKAAAAEASKMGENNKASGPPKQGTLATVTDEVLSIRSGAIPSDMFEPPAGYREVTERAPPSI